MTEHHLQGQQGQHTAHEKRNRDIDCLRCIRSVWAFTLFVPVCCAGTVLSSPLQAMQAGACAGRGLQADWTR
jgi:hypothetical protein